MRNAGSGGILRAGWSGHKPPRAWRCGPTVRTMWAVLVVSREPAVVLEPLRELDGRRPIDAAERLRGLGGLVLLRGDRPGRRSRWTFLSADPVAIEDAPADGPDPFRRARALLGRLHPGVIGTADAPPWTGGLAGYLSYDLGRRLERLPDLADDDQGLPLLRLGLYDWVVAWDGQDGTSWLVTRAVDGDLARMRERRERVRALLSTPPCAPAAEPAELDGWIRFRSNLRRAAFISAVERVREEIAAGEIYQANVSRRLEAAFSGDPWPLYQRLGTADPVPFGAYLDLDPSEDGSHRAILSASPERFLAMSPEGRIATGPIKGTRPRGATRTEDRGEALALLGSEKDRAENVMIVDVHRHDLGRVCVPGSVAVPRLCRLERTGSVQHLVSTVVGRLAPGLDAFDLLSAAFPGGSVTGAPKVRAMEIIEAVEPVRRGPYCGAAVWLGADGAMGSSILIRTLVADGRRLTLHVGGGITWRSDPAAEWEETRAKARGPLAALGAVEIAPDDEDGGSVAAEPAG